MNKAESTLLEYISELEKAYDSLNRVLLLEAADIEQQDEHKLQLHAAVEADTVRMIISLTNSVQTYLESVEPDSSMREKLRNISFAKAAAQQQINANVEALRRTMMKIKTRIDSVKLPKSARRVYYSGNTPTIMDIEI